MLTPIYLTTNQSEECPQLILPSLNNYYKIPHYPLCVTAYSFEGISPLWALLPGKETKIFLSTSPKLCHRDLFQCQGTEARFSFSTRPLKSQYRFQIFHYGLMYFYLLFYSTLWWIRVIILFLLIFSPNLAQVGEQVRQSLKIISVLLDLAPFNCLFAFISLFFLSSKQNCFEPRSGISHFSRRPGSTE